jgi:hypothetical protein
MTTSNPYDTDELFCRWCQEKISLATIEEENVEMHEFCHSEFQKTLISMARREYLEMKHG